jgi:ABC-type sugar transport system ATPase subunit
MHTQASALLKSSGERGYSRPLLELGVAEQQMVEIAKALAMMHASWCWTNLPLP